MKSKILGLLAVGLLALANTAQATTIGQWTGSARSWNAADFSTIKATMTGGGHVVAADGAITAANLTGYGMFVIGEATTGLSAGESTICLTGCQAAECCGSAWIQVATSLPQMRFCPASGARCPFWLQIPASAARLPQATLQRTICSISWARA